MEHNLIPPFILREAGLIVNKRLKIHTDSKERNIYDHSILDNNSDLHIRMNLDGVFSTFHSRALTNEDLQRDDNTFVMITPEGEWDPNNKVYEENKNALLDCEGNIIAYNERKPPNMIIDDIDTELLEQIDYDVKSTAVMNENDRLLQVELSDLTFNEPSTTYCDEEAALISTICESTRALNEPIDIPNYIGYIPGNAKECDIHVNAIAFTQAIIDFERECDFQSSIGSI